MIRCPSLFDARLHSQLFHSCVQHLSHVKLARAKLGRIERRETHSNFKAIIGVSHGSSLELDRWPVPRVCVAKLSYPRLECFVG